MITIIACQEEGCDNNGAPYFLETEYEDPIDCPVCGVAMVEIADPRGEELA